jgi:hypothetical protein
LKPSGRSSSSSSRSITIRWSQFICKFAYNKNS